MFMKYFSLIILVLSLLSFNVEASIFDKGGANKVILDLIDSANSIAKSDYANAEKLITKAKLYSEKSGFEFGEARSVFSLGYINQVNGKKDKSIIYYLEAKKILDQQNSTESTKLNASCTRNIGMIFHSHFQYEQAIEYFELSKKLAKKAKSKKLEAIAMYYKAKALTGKEEYSLAIDNLFLASEIALAEKDYKYLIKLNNQIGLLFKKTGDYENANKHFFETFVYKSELDDFSKYGSTAFHNIANTYILMGDSLKAEEYFLKAIDSKVIYGDTKKLFLSFMDLAELYKNRNQLDLARLLLCNFLHSNILPLLQFLVQI